MAIEVSTKDCTALSDAELTEMADICAEGPSHFEAGLLSKQAESWVLVTLAREGRALRGFSYSHARAHRWHAEHPDRAGLGEAHEQARRRPAGDRDRSVPPGRAGLPRRGRARRHPLHHPVGLRGFPHARGHRPAAGAQGQRRGAGVGSAPGQALRRRERRLRRPRLPHDGRQHLPARARPRQPEAREARSRGRGLLRRGRLRRAATRSSPSAGRWPSSSPSCPDAVA